MDLIVHEILVNTVHISEFLYKFVVKLICGEVR